jgi:hypothetical protein
MKEREERESDGLDVPRIPDDYSSRSESESSVSDDEHWADESSLSASESESVASRQSDLSLGTEKSRSRERWSRALGLDDGFRKEVVGWMLDARVDLPFVNGLSDNYTGPSEHHSDAKRHRRN